MSLSRNAFRSRKLYGSKSRRSAFTLLEVLLVLAILGVIATLVVPNLIGTQDKAYRKTTTITIKGLEDVVKQYAVDHDGQFPEGNSDKVFAELLNPQVDQSTGKQLAPYLERVPEDAWKTPLQYQYDQGMPRPKIWSLGPDKKDGTGDEIHNTTDRASA